MTKQSKPKLIEVKLDKTTSREFGNHLFKKILEIKELEKLAGVLNVQPPADFTRTTNEQKVSMCKLILDMDKKYHEMGWCTAHEKGCKAEANGKVLKEMLIDASMQLNKVQGEN